MKTITCLLLVVAYSNLFSQDCYNSTMQLAKQFYASAKYKQATKQFKAAQTCEDKPTQLDSTKMLEKWVKKSDSMEVILVKLQAAKYKALYLAGESEALSPTQQLNVLSYAYDLSEQQPIMKRIQDNVNMFAKNQNDYWHVGFETNETILHSKYSPDLTCLAYCSDRDKVHFYNISTQKELSITNLPSYKLGTKRFLAISQDNRYFLCSYTEDTLLLHNVISNTDLLIPIDKYTEAVFFLHNTSHIFMASTFEISLYSLRGEKIKSQKNPATEYRNFISCAAQSKDGKKIAVAYSNEVIVMDNNFAPICRFNLSGGEDVDKLSFSPNDSLLTIIALNNTIEGGNCYVWNMYGEKDKARLIPDRQHIRDIQWSKSGKYLFIDRVEKMELLFQDNIWEIPKPNGKDFNNMSAFFSLDENTLYTVKDGYYLYQWNVGQLALDYNSMLFRYQYDSTLKQKFIPNFHPTKEWKSDILVSKMLFPNDSVIYISTPKGYSVLMPHNVSLSKFKHNIILNQLHELTFDENHHIYADFTVNPFYTRHKREWTSQGLKVAEKEIERIKDASNLEEKTNTKILNPTKPLYLEMVSTREKDSPNDIAKFSLVLINNETKKQIVILSNVSQFKTVEYKFSPQGTYFIVLNGNACNLYKSDDGTLVSTFIDSEYPIIDAVFDTQEERIATFSHSGYTNGYIETWFTPKGCQRFLKEQNAVLIPISDDIRQKYELE